MDGFGFDDYGSSPFEGFVAPAPPPSADDSLESIVLAAERAEQLGLSDLNQAKIAKLVKGLTPDQRRSAIHSGSPILVLAGAGTGKTHVLTTRIALLVTAGKARGDEILALTFTKKAAAEMKKRIALYLDSKDNGITACTFHSLCGRIVREYGGEMGWRTDFTIIDPEDVTKLFRQCFRERHNKPAPADVMKPIIEGYDLAKRAEDYDAALYAMSEDAQEIIKAYSAKKRDSNVKDYSDLISDALLLVSENSNILQKLRDRWTHLLIDEYQDTDSQQALFVHYLCGGNPNLTVVGDDDQAIYTWRGARVENILQFQDEFEGAALVRLEDNFRSTSNILNVANALISQNEDRLGKVLVTDAASGSPVAYMRFHHALDEAAWIAEQVQTQVARGRELTDMAVLSRSGMPLNIIEHEFTKRGIRYTLSAGKKFQDRQEIKDIASYLRLLVNAEDKPAFARAIAAPKRNVGPALIEEIEQAAKKLKVPILDAARRYALGEMAPQNAREPILQFCQLMEEIAAAAVHDEARAGEIVTRLVDETGYRRSLQMARDEAKEAAAKEDAQTTENRLENIASLIEIGSDKTIVEFLDHLGLSQEDHRDDGEGVWIGTIHAAKGLEWKVVYLPAWEDGILPTRQSKGDDMRVQEERRLGYVAITRARQDLIITSANRRNNEPATPSPFIADAGLHAKAIARAA